MRSIGQCSFRKTWCAANGVKDSYVHESGSHGPGCEERFIAVDHDFEVPRSIKGRFGIQAVRCPEVDIRRDQALFHRNGPKRHASRHRGHSDGTRVSTSLTCGVRYKDGRDMQITTGAEDACRTQMSSRSKKHERQSKQTHLAHAITIGERGRRDSTECEGSAARAALCGACSSPIDETAGLRACTPKAVIEGALISPFNRFADSAKVHEWRRAWDEQAVFVQDVLTSRLRCRASFNGDSNRWFPAWHPALGCM